MTTKIAVLLLYILSSATGFVLIKKSTTLLSVNFIFGNILYVLGYVIWVLVLLRMFPLSIAFPLASGGLLIASQIAGHLYLDEDIDIYNIGAIFLILAGILLLMYKGISSE